MLLLDSQYESVEDLEGRGDPQVNHPLVDQYEGGHVEDVKQEPQEPAKPLVEPDIRLSVVEHLVAVRERLAVLGSVVRHTALSFLVGVNFHSDHGCGPHDHCGNSFPLTTRKGL